MLLSSGSKSISNPCSQEGYEKKWQVKNGFSLGICAEQHGTWSAEQPSRAQGETSVFSLGGWSNFCGRGHFHRFFFLENVFFKLRRLPPVNTPGWISEWAGLTAVCFILSVSAVVLAVAAQVEWDALLLPRALELSRQADVRLCGKPRSLFFQVPQSQ